MALCLSLFYIHLNSAVHVGIQGLGFREQRCPGPAAPCRSHPRPKLSAPPHPLPPAPSRLSPLGFLNCVQTGGYFQDGFCLIEAATQLHLNLFIAT